MLGFDTDRRTSLLFAALFCMTLLFAIWPIYRASRNIEIQGNEGWNAYQADAAMGRSELYPDPRSLIANNYPPLSYYVVGFLGRIVGDAILAGRLISLISVAVIGVVIALCVRQLNGSIAASWLAGLYFVATMCRFFTVYVGMNDPQLLAQALMVIGLYLFIRADARGASYWIPLLIMVIAGFFKHNIVCMPVTAMIWIGLMRPRRLVGSTVFALSAAAIGLMACRLAYGPNFLGNLMAPRVYDWRIARDAAGHLQFNLVGLVAATYLCAVRGAEPRVRFCQIFVLTSFIMFFVQKSGAGVACNAQFDLTIAVAMGIGVAFDEIPSIALAQTYSTQFLRAALVAAVCCRLALSTSVEPFRMISDPTFYTELHDEEARTAAIIADIRREKADVAGDLYACYRAGKPFIVDFFSVVMRTRLGKLPEDVVTKRISDGSLKVVDLKRN